MAITTKILDKIGFLRNGSFFLRKPLNNFPDFLGIGAQKSGTTWLYKNLKEHPEIFLPQTKEIHFFDWYFYKSINWYCSYFRDAKRYQKKGEITPCYSTLSEEKIKAIQEMNPKLKIILLLRNPIERAWSQAVMNLSKNNGKVKNFELVDLFTIIKIATSKRKKDFHLIKKEEFINHFNHSRSIERGNYLKIIKKWSKFFPENQIFIGDYNQLQKSPQKLLNRIFTFLDTELVTDWVNFPLTNRINTTKKDHTKIPNELYEYLSKMYDKDIKELRKEIPAIKW